MKLIFLMFHSFLCIQSTFSMFAYWDAFWETSCSYVINPHSTHSRSKRDLGDIMESRNAQELFHYLYPAAAADKSEFEHRSMNTQSENESSTSVMSWTGLLYGLKDFWLEECYSRHKNWIKQSKAGESINANASIELPPRHEKHASSQYQNSSLKLSSRKKKRKSKQIDIEEPVPLIMEEDPVFFSAYGGDIEYFFPLISFGIPFDGEITFLGFHGFKGLFPYR